MTSSHPVPSRAVDARALPAARGRRAHTAASVDTTRSDALPASAAIQDYAKAIYVLSEETGGAVPTSAIAERMGVSAASASAMIKRLAEMELVAHVPYRGVELTGEGRRIALEMVRHHRLLELFLHETFDMPWDEVHDEAEVLEHAISERLEELIAQKLGNPRFDPHGDPIPTRDGEIDAVAHVPINELPVGASGLFVRVSDSDPEMLRYLAGQGIAPNQRFTVRERQPFGGPMFVDFEGLEPRQVIGAGLAEAMRVVPDASVAMAPKIVKEGAR